MDKLKRALKLAEPALIKATMVYEANDTHPVAKQQALNARAAVSKALDYIMTAERDWGYARAHGHTSKDVAE